MLDGMITSSAISIHALFAEGDAPARRSAPRRGISIHALFAEGDSPSRPPARGGAISIHALFAEGDGKYAQFNSAYLINLYIS